MYIGVYVSGFMYVCINIYVCILGFMYKYLYFNMYIGVYVYLYFNMYILKLKMDKFIIIGIFLLLCSVVTGLWWKFGYYDTMANKQKSGDYWTVLFIAFIGLLISLLSLSYGLANMYKDDIKTIKDQV